MDSIIKKEIDNLMSTALSEDEEMSSESYKKLRFLFVNSENNQNYMIKQKLFLDNTKNKFLKENTPHKTVEHILKFYGNLCVQNIQACEFITNNYMQCIITQRNSGRNSFNITVQVLYMILIQIKIDDILIYKDVIFECLDDIITNEESESCSFIYHIMESSTCLYIFYDDFNEKQWDLILNLLDSKKDLKMHINGQLCKIYKENIANIIEQSDDIDVIKLMRLCEYMSDHCNDDNITMIEDEQFLCITIDILKKLQDKTNNGDKRFQIIEMVDKNYVKNSFDGLKRYLIQYIGICTFHRREKQDLARIQGALPHILSNTNYDSRNPYIRERSVFTIKCLCENNIENQDIYSKYQKINKII